MDKPFQFEFNESDSQQVVNEYSIPKLGYVPESVKQERITDNFVQRAVLNSFLPLSKDGRRIPAIWLTRSQNGNYVVNSDAVVYDQDEMPTNFYLPQGSLILGELNDYYPERLDLALEPQWGIKLQDATKLSEEAAKELSNKPVSINLDDVSAKSMPTTPEIKKSPADTPDYVKYALLAGAIIGGYALLKSFRN